MSHWSALNRFFKCIFSFCIILSLLSFTNSGMAAVLIEEQIQIPSSPNPVGSGARALGMGGAFIAIADDATAASWNPGGLIQLEKPELSIVGAYFDRSISTSFADYPEASGEHDVSEVRLNYFSLSYPFQAFQRNMTISLNYQNLYDLTNQWHFPLYQKSDTLNITQTVDTRQNGSLSALGLAYCIEIIPDLSMGVTFNFWEDTLFHQNKWEQTTNRQVSGSFMGFPITGELFSKDVYHFSGFNANFGALWHISGRWTLGAVLKTPFTADVKHEHHRKDFLQTEAQILAEGETNTIRSEKLTMPLSYGIGLACRISDKLTIAGDLYRTEWGNFIHEDAGGRKTSAVTGTPENEADIDATHQIRLGAEYLFIKPGYAIPLRGGIFYDPAPASGQPDDYFGFSLGSGIAYGRFIFDVAFQHRFGNNVGQSFSRNLNAPQDLREYTVYSSLIIHF